MNTKEKLEKFMSNRKRAEDTGTLAAYFMCGKSTINRIMGELENENKVIRRKGSGGKNIWQWNYVAFPKRPIAIQPNPEPTPTIGRPIKTTTSYPNIRGYDD